VDIQRQPYSEKNTVSRGKKVSRSPRKDYPADRHKLTGRMIRLFSHQWAFLKNRERTTGVKTTAQIRELVERSYRAAKGGGH
jgi:hypothetical protein